MTVSTHTRTLGITGAEATGTVTITAYLNLNTGDKVNLIATDGTNYDFVNGDQSSVAGTWESTVSNDQTATNLMNVINTGSGPAGTRFSASVLGAVVTITQSSNSEASLEDGNTAITLTDTFAAGMTADSAFTGGSSSAVVNDRGVVMQGGNIAGSKYTNKSILDTVKGANEYGSQLGLVTGTSHKVGLAVVRSVGSPKFAFFPKKIDRTATNATFLARGLQTKIAGAASTEDIMGVLGQNQGARGTNLHTDDHYQRGSWSTLAFNLFRNPTAGDNSETTGLVQSDGTAKSGATNYGTAAIFRNLADQDNARPVTNVPTRAVPGEIVFMIDFASWPFSAGEPTGGNYKDYSAITGG
jgi:hypothetical protein